MTIFHGQVVQMMTFSWKSCQNYYFSWKSGQNDDFCKKNNIKSLEDFAGLTTDDLIGYFEDKSDKSSKVDGLLEEFNLTKDEGDQLIMEARKIWLE